MPADKTAKASKAETTVAVVHQRAGLLDGLHMTLDPARVLLDLRPRSAGRWDTTPGVGAQLSAIRNPQSAIRNQEPLWRHVKKHPGTVHVTLESELEKPLLVRCHVRPADEGWQRRWVVWRYASRRVPDHLGGDAVERQDKLDEESQTLTLMLLPGERRNVTLELHAYLDGATWTGNFGYEVVAEDPEEGTEVVRAGLLTLRTPDSAFLRQLPGIYQEAMLQERDRSPQSLDTPFFERYLRGFEDAIEPVQEMLGRMHELFGGQTAPRDFLPWLATWVALALDHNWPELRRRRLICEAVELYKWRGTRKGLSRYLELYTGVTPEIHDQPIAGMRLGPDARLGKNTILGGLPPHCFTVAVTVPEDSPINEQTVRDIIESEKPAHTAYELRFTRR